MKRSRTAFVILRSCPTMCRAEDDLRSLREHRCRRYRHEHRGARCYHHHQHHYHHHHGGKRDTRKKEKEERGRRGVP
ncbi:putative uncharacterized protein YOR053W [Harpegnathos saltator]|uniref:putative uncharacterized protein YOR053W n=1 Tax=Harpegnathos saltator TaxID=610380 RepID=UPI000DBED94D|nr:putative uncharacterized protein YOR053W [Harpegnathos saltator]